MKSYDTVVLTFRPVMVEEETTGGLISLIDQHKLLLEKRIKVKNWEILLLNGSLMIFLEVPLEQKSSAEEYFRTVGFTLVKRISPTSFKLVKKENKKYLNQFENYLNRLPQLATFGIY